MIQFKGFKPQAMQRIAGTLGYQGDMSGFNDYLNQNPDKKQQMNMYQQKAVQMLRGGLVKMQQGGMVFTGGQQGFFDLNKAKEAELAGLAGAGYDTSKLTATGYDITKDKFDADGFIGDPRRMRQDLTFDKNTGTYKSFGLGSATIATDSNFNPVGGQLIGQIQTPTSYNFTYDQALGRQQQRDLKSPEEQAAINAALARGPDPSSVNVDPRTTAQTSTPPQAPAYEGESITELQAQRALDPSLPYGATVQPVGTQITSDQIIDPRSGQVTGDITTPITTATTAQADMPEVTDAAKVDAAKVSDQVANVVAQTTAAQGEVDPRAIVDAQQATSSSVSELEAAQGKAVLMDNPIQRKVEAGELVSSVSNAATAAKFTEEIQAAQATPTKQATVQGQLETLMQQFEGGNTPAWAAGAMRNATATMAARGLGASSMAGQALVQAAMESAIPVAQADASVIASFEAQNLSNRQQRAMLAAEQRATFIGQEFDQAFQARVINASKISDIANMNFTAEQQVALENSRAANTMNLANLSNRQALVMSEAAALANMDMANLNNRQQAAVMNAQSFLQMDMANLSNQQQTEMFKAQTQVQSLFTDQAAENAARQFNASSQNQTDQFFANLQTQASQFNTAQANAQAQFNAGESNVMNRFAAEMMNQRDQFNAQNRLVIDQNNAQWRRQVATADTAAINRANEINATNLLDISNTAYNNLWSYYQDSMEWAWNSAENERQRIVDLASIKLQVDAKADIASMEADYNSSAAWGGLMATMFTTPLGGDTLLGKGLGALFGG